MLIRDYPKRSSVGDNDYILVDTSDAGSKAIKASDVANYAKGKIWLPASATQGGYVPATGGSSGKVLGTNSSGVPVWMDITDSIPAAEAWEKGLVVSPNGQKNYVYKTNSSTGKPEWAPFPTNSASQAGLVAKGSGNVNKVWGTDASGNPGWQTLETSEGGNFDSVRIVMSSGNGTANSHTCIYYAAPVERYIGTAAGGVLYSFYGSITYIYGQAFSTNDAFDIPINTPSGYDVVSFAVSSGSILGGGEWLGVVKSQSNSTFSFRTADIWKALTGNDSNNNGIASFVITGAFSVSTEMLPVGNEIEEHSDNVATIRKAASIDE